jgi:hypothetical protein
MGSKLIEFSNIDKSPLGFIYEFGKRYYTPKNNYHFEFSIYESGGQGITISRNIFTIELTSSIYENLTNLLNSLPVNKELAIHSRIYFDNKIYHIPFIDFTFQNWESLSFQMISKIKSIFDKKLFVYNSGRSYHGYILTILDSGQWIRYLAKLLLLNRPKSSSEYVDSRWIGHSIEQQFCALRLSCNSHYYIKVPELIGVY